jgi:hypothetical protein
VVQREGGPIEEIRPGDVVWFQPGLRRRARHQGERLRVSAEDAMKPYVICLMACSVDGRTLPSRWRPEGAAGDVFERVHDKLAGDAWVIGRVTGQEFAKGKSYPGSAKEAQPHQGHRSRSQERRDHLACSRRHRRKYPDVLDHQRGSHWHGASPTNAMTHIAIQESVDGKAVDWMEKVSDEQYRK